jgi:hypothetical protein
LVIVIERVPAFTCPAEATILHSNAMQTHGVRSVGSSLNEQQIRIPDMLQG